MNTLLYLCYGARRNFDEARYSILSSLLHKDESGQSYQIVVYTDDPAPFEDLDVLTVPIDSVLLHEWLGGSDYIHRRKTMTVLDALHRFAGRIAFIDCDTWFLRAPGVLFDFIDPGRACLHLVEGRLEETRTKVDQSVSDLVRNRTFKDLSGAPIQISPDARMWNSGVIGIHSDDRGLIEEALHLSDQMWQCAYDYEPGKKAHHFEQFATGIFLERLELRETQDVVYHYWPDYLRIRFSGEVGPLVRRRDGVSLREQASFAYSHRPQADLMRKIKMKVRHRLRQVGIRVPGIRNSA